MRKSTIVLSILTLVLFVLLIWQWSSKSYYFSQMDIAGKYNAQLGMLSGIGPLRSAHLHADVKVYMKGKPIDFSQRKYQLATDYIHFEEGIGDVIHTHATGLTVGHMLNSVGIKFNGQCLVFEGNKYCSEGNRTIKFYVNGKRRDEMYSYAINDIDKILVSHGTEDEAGIQNQIGSITNLAAKYSS